MTHSRLVSALLLASLIASSVRLPLAMAQGGAAAPSAAAPSAAPSAAAPESPADPLVAEATALKARGDELFKDRSFAKALDAYRESYARHRNPAVRYNMGRCLQLMGRSVEALEELERFKAEAAPELLKKVPGLDGMLTTLRAEVSTVELKVNERGVRVMLRDQLVGETPLQGPIRVTAGPAKLELSKEGFFPVSRSLKLEGGKSLQLELTLRSRARHGLLTVTSKIAGADIWVDDQKLGRAPAETTLLAGEHRIRAVREGHKEATATVVMRIGERKTLNLDPEPPAPFYATWWFWTSIGVVAVAGATTGVLLTTDKSGSSGDFSPGRLPAP